MHDPLGLTLSSSPSPATALDSEGHILGQVPLPVSFNQEKRLLFEEWARTCGIRDRPFHIVLSLGLQGSLNPVRLQDALNQIIRRHAVLRTAFHPSKRISTRDRLTNVQSFINTGTCEPGLFEQRVFSDAPLVLRVENIENLSPEQQRTESQKVIDQEALEPFDYERPPLMRAVALSMGTTRHRLILIVHHLVGDLWSLRILRKELAAIYAGLQESRPWRLPELPRQYFDFAKWQQEQLRASPSFDRSLSHWREQWFAFQSSIISYRDLPFATQKPQMPTLATGIETLTLGPKMSRQVKAFAARSHVTHYVMFLTGLNVLLHLYTGKPKVAVWGHFANRTSPETQNLIGWFVNTNIIGVNLASDPPVRELLQQVRDVVLESSAHDQMPVVLMWRALGHSFHQTDGTVVFDATLNGDLGGDGQELSDRLKITEAALVDVGAQVDLYVFTSEMEQGTKLSAAYSMDRFTAIAIRKFLENFRNTLGNLLINPDTRISRLSLAKSGPTENREVSQISYREA